MPFKSKSQIRACYAKRARGEAGTWDCEEWSDATKDPKKLPETVKTASKLILPEFIKIAKKLFKPLESPPIPTEIIQRNAIESAKQDKMQGLNPVEYRNEVTSRSKGIVARNKQTSKAG